MFTVTTKMQIEYSYAHIRSKDVTIKLMQLTIETCTSIIDQMFKCHLFWENCHLDIVYC